MKKFLLLIREDLHKVMTMTPEQQNADIQTMIKWVEELTQSGHFLQGDPLETGMRIATKEGILSDGPFIEAKEGISGYTMIQAEDLDQAADLAAACPLVQSGQLKIEVRPILEF
jgi:hypothetical protein